MVSIRFKELDGKQRVLTDTAASSAQAPTPSLHMCVCMHVFCVLPHISQHGKLRYSGLAN
jgi:hypothetical protein